MKNIITLFFLLLTAISFSQTKSDVVENVGGKKYYVHTVEKGTTLYSIKKLYDVDIDDILEANPGAEAGIKEGQKILIPCKKCEVTTSSTINNTNLNTSEHTVENSETLYSIAKKYNTSVEKIISLNPGVEAGIRVGQKLKIPSGSEVPVITNDRTFSKDPNPTKTPVVRITKDTIIEHVVQEGETLYSLSKRYMAKVEDVQALNNLNTLNIKPGQVLKIPVKAENRAELNLRNIESGIIVKLDSTLLFPKKESYNIAVLLPLNLDRGPGYNAAITQYALEFWMGTQLALDSLVKNGFKAEIFLHDTKHDSTTVKSILASDEAQTYDIIIGPLYQSHITYVAEWCKLNQKRMICPVAIPSELLFNNPYVTAMIPSDMSLMETEADYILQNFKGQTIILVKPTTSEDLLAYDAFRERFKTAPYIGTRPNLIEATIDNFATFTKSSGKSVVVMPSTDKATSLKFMNALNKSSNGRITIFTTKEWLVFDDIKGQYKNKYKMHFASPYDFNYSYDKTKSVLRRFRRKYNYDFTKMAALGYDVMLYTGFAILMEKECNFSVMSRINIKETAPGSGYENKSAYIFYQEEFEIYNVEIPRVEEDKK